MTTEHQTISLSGAERQKRLRESQQAQLGDASLAHRYREVALPILDALFQRAIDMGDWNLAAVTRKRIQAVETVTEEAIVEWFNRAVGHHERGLVQEAFSAFWDQEKG